MSIDVVILGLNMDAVNALIRCSAILAKMGIAAAVLGCILWLIVLLLSVEVG